MALHEYGLRAAFGATVEVEDSRISDRDARVRTQMARP
jgi:hypothetical protein